MTSLKSFSTHDVIAKVFYCEIEYKTNNTVQSYLRDGINYVKIITIKESNDSPWKLEEMSAAENPDIENIRKN